MCLGRGGGNVRTRSLGVYFGLFFMGGVIGAAIYNEKVGNANSIPGLAVSVLIGMSTLLIISSFMEIGRRIKFRSPGFYGIIKALLGIFLLAPALSMMMILPPRWATYIMFGSMLSMGIFMIIFGPYVAAGRIRK